MSAPSENWLAAGASARGASHIRTGMPNQDAIGWRVRGSGGNLAAMVVSDGHGGPQHGWSEVGSRLAVETALHEFAELPNDGEELADSIHLLAARCHARWLAAIGEHAQAKGAANDPVIYGATLVGVQLIGSQLLLVQIGDGDIVLGRVSGRIERVLPEDTGLTSEQTHSLCQNDAPSHARLALIDTNGSDPVDFIMVSSDGVAKSFEDDAAFFRLAADFRNRVGANGLGAISDRLGGWLSDLSARGSGDDATLGIISRCAPATAKASKSQAPVSRGPSTATAFAFVAGFAVALAASMLNPWRPWQPWVTPVVLPMTPPEADAPGKAENSDTPAPAETQQDGAGEKSPPAKQQQAPAADAPEQERKP